MDEILWCEKYRPQTVADCVLPERLKTVFQSYVDSKTIPNLMLTGSAGVGKTTVAKAMCNEIGLNYMFINSSDERGIDTLRNKITNYASTISLTGGQKVIILDEADYLTPEAQAGLRGAIESFSGNCTFIMTCNFKSKLIDALHSRTSVIDFQLKSEEKPEMAAKFLHRIEDILTKENVIYEKQPLVKLIQKFFPDYRRILNELQRYSKFGSIDAGIVAQIADIRKFSELIGYLKNKDFSAMRKWVALNSDIEANHIYRAIYDGLYDYFKPESIPQAVVILGKYQFQAGFVVDQEINLCSCLVEVMVDCEFV